MSFQDSIIEAGVQRANWTDALPTIEIVADLREFAKSAMPNGGVTWAQLSYYNMYRDVDWQAVYNAVEARRLPKTLTTNDSAVEAGRLPKSLTTNDTAETADKFLKAGFVLVLPEDTEFVRQRAFICNGEYVLELSNTTGYFYEKAYVDLTKFWEYFCEDRHGETVELERRDD